MFQKTEHAKMRATGEHSQTWGQLKLERMSSCVHLSFNLVYLV